MKERKVLFVRILQTEARLRSLGLADLDVVGRAAVKQNVPPETTFGADIGR